MECPELALPGPGSHTWTGGEEWTLEPGVTRTVNDKPETYPLYLVPSGTLLSSSFFMKAIVLFLLISFADKALNRNKESEE